MTHPVPLEQAWRFLLETLKRGIVVVDQDGVIVDVGSTVEKWLESTSVLGTALGSWTKVPLGLSDTEGEIELVSTSGIVRKVTLSGKHLTDDNGQPAGRLLLLTDQFLSRVMEGRLIDEVRRMAKLAGEDSLTGLANRRAFDEALQTMQQELERKFGVVVVDLDDFKVVNDTFGHRVGDQVLVACANLLRQLTRSDDLVARIGGDEFAILLPNVTMLALTETAERLRKELVIQIQVNGSPLRVYSSVGYAHSGPDPTNVVERADKWMYQNKSEREGISTLAAHEAELVDGSH